jgi:hypothetical protein
MIGTKIGSCGFKPLKLESRPKAKPVASDIKKPTRRRLRALKLRNGFSAVILKSLSVVSGQCEGEQM